MKRILLCALVLAFAGCGPAGPKMVPVEGTLRIRLFGKEVDASNISVQFLPDVMKGGKGPTTMGITGEGGKFTLLGQNGEKGAVVGAHKVILADLNEERPPQGEYVDPNRMLSRIPTPYTIITTAASVTVPEEGGAVYVDVVWPPVR